MNEDLIKEKFCRPADERALLAYVMKDMDFFYSLTSKISPSDFLYPAHTLLLLVFSTLLNKGAQKLELNLVVSEAQANGVLELVGGIRYLQAISSMPVSNENFDVYLKSVIESSTKFKLYTTLTENLQHLDENAKEGMDSTDLLSKVEADIFTITTSGPNINEPINLADGLREFIEFKKNNKIEISGLSTGFPILNKQIDGLIPGTLAVVAARKKMGKSAFLTTIAIHAAFRESKPVLYVDTELSYEEWRTRALAAISGLDERSIKHGGFDDVQYRKLTLAAELIEKGKLYHEYMPGYSVDKLVSLYKKYKHKENIGLIVFDYLKEPDSSSIEKNRKEYQVLGDVTTKLKDLSGQLKIPALTAVQLNRDNDIADSDRIARYADVICHWSARDEKEIDEGGRGSGTHKLVIRDTRRGGATNSHGIGYNFFKESLCIREVAIDKQYFANYNETVNDESAGSFEDYENESL